ncbi:MAG: alpha/beta hydrolase [Hyphomonadaceae bacterium]|nr:alpha/beta hydrolase [Hyphomonadaceae bacterium]
MRRAIAALLAALTIAACAPSLGTFNALSRRDAARVAGDVPYGEGPRRHLDVYAPKAGASRGASGLPVIVFFYGGSWASGDRGDYAFAGDALAGKGFVTVVPDYRVYPEVRFPDFIEDGADAVKWTQENAARYGGDPSRIVLVGHSAGAYIAAMLGLDAHYLNDAGVDARAIRGVAGLSGPYDFLPLDREATQNAFGAAEDPAATQPVNFARADAPAFLLVWGEKDDLVRRRNIDGLSRALRDAGAAPEVKLYPSLGHSETLLSFSRLLRGRAPVLDDVSAFAKRVTAEAVAPPPVAPRPPPP